MDVIDAMATQRRKSELEGIIQTCDFMILASGGREDNQAIHNRDMRREAVAELEKVNKRLAEYGYVVGKESL